MFGESTYVLPFPVSENKWSREVYIYDSVFSSYFSYFTSKISASGTFYSMNTILVVAFSLAAVLRALAVPIAYPPDE